MTGEEVEIVSTPEVDDESVHVSEDKLLEKGIAYRGHWNDGRPIPKVPQPVTSDQIRHDIAQ